MRLTLDISPELERQLTQAVQGREITIAALAERLLEASIAGPNKPDLAKLFAARDAANEAVEQGPADEIPIETLKAHPPDQREYLSPDMKGITW